jgi:hypothetical protein
VCIPAISAVTDAAIAVTVVQSGGDIREFYGIAFRESGQDNYYLFAISGRGRWGLLLYANGAATPLVTSTANVAIQTGIGASNRLEVVAQGSQFGFFVNGKQVGTASDTSYRGGIFGLAGADNTEVVFTDLTVTAEP